METAITQQNEQTPRLAQTGESTRLTFPNPTLQNLSDIIDKSRRLKGWTALDDDSQAQAMGDWIEILNAARINGKHYHALYIKCTEVRASALQAGKTPPDISAELMASQWPALFQEIQTQTAHEQSQNAPTGKKYIHEDGKIKCHYCLGSNFRPVTRHNVYGTPYNGVIPCQHEENGYQFTDGDEVVSGEEGIRIIESYLARQGMEFNTEIKNVLYAKFNR